MKMVLLLFNSCWQHNNTTYSITMISTIALAMYTYIKDAKKKRNPGWFTRIIYLKNKIVLYSRKFTIKLWALSASWCIHIMVVSFNRFIEIAIIECGTDIPVCSVVIIYLKSLRIITKTNLNDNNWIGFASMDCTRFSSLFWDALFILNRFIMLIDNATIIELTQAEFNRNVFFNTNFPFLGHVFYYCNGINMAKLWIDIYQ